MDRALNPRVGTRHNSNCASRNGRINKVFAIDPCARKGAENRARRHLAMVYGKAGNGLAIFSPKKRAQLHAFLAFSFKISVRNSSTAKSLAGSGKTPSIGPVREITFDTTGAAV